ncbi:unnamed protein product [Tilletia controversa]|uniref:DNA damage-binding protein 1 n=1 Tax=Tilletia controversa TaxID=13291 RepID=A0A8X7MU44_9BASI|nr:hypothetical protein CF328_g6118 [Tilletia controversa]KAE8248519.1 hypothetical protein A4X06_0g3654 [Tilletia controversa]CAD6897317.1 unnamed protein product [Tilletia controversa]CAD6958777.1 unnamed protein product [Tilletia controversa]CAD6964401.1 unnamed protein product [Tilletia controversa]
MLYLTHLHPASARSASVRTSASTIAFVGHSSIDILSTAATAAAAAEPLARIATLPFNARILQAATLPSRPGSLCILTDHPVPRLLILVPEPGTHARYATHTVIQLQDSVRSPAELGIGMCLDSFTGIDHTHTPIVFTHTYAGNARVVPLPADALAQPPSTPSPIGALAGFDLRLPHPTLIQTTFLDSRNLSTAPLPPLVALLSLSSTPTTLPGLGPQCLPVLSFHWIDTDKQELTPCPWGPPPTPTPGPTPSSSSSSTTAKAAAAAEGSSQGSNTAASGTRRSGRNSTVKTYGPSAKGADRSIPALLARDKKLAAQESTRAHVPLPYIEALGAHFLLALPARAGGGVLVFSESCVLYVPPPPSALGGSSSALAGSSSSENQEAPAVAGISSSTAKGKRRKGTEFESDASALDPSSASSSISPHEASATVNEHGKRRRESGAGTVSGDSGSSRGEILRTAFRKPVQVVAAIVQAEPASSSSTSPSSTTAVEDDGIRQTASDGRTAAIRVLFATQAGILHSLVISLTLNAEVSGRKRYAPVSMQVSKIGNIPRPGSGSGGLLYLGEGFLQVASMVGDSALVRIEPEFVPSPYVDSNTTATTSESGGVRDEWEDGEEEDGMEVDGDSQRVSASASATGKGHLSAGVQEYKRFPNLAPIIDFVIDHGKGTGGDPSSSTSSSNLPARIVTCSGTGPSGSLRSVRTGAEIIERGSISLDSVGASAAAPSAVFILGRTGGSTGGTVQEGHIVLLSYPERTEGFLQTIVDGDLRWEPLSAGLETVGFSAESVLAASALPTEEGDSFNVVVVSASRVRVVQIRDNGEVTLRAEWGVDGEGVGTTVVAAVDERGRIMLARADRKIIHLQARGASIERVCSVPVEDDVASLNLCTIGSGTNEYSLLTAGFFVKRSVRLYALPTLEDVTPELLSMQMFSSLPCRVLVHPFDCGSALTSTDSAQLGAMYLFVGFADGALISYRLDRADAELSTAITDTAEAPSAATASLKLTISDRRTVSLGSTPIRSLTPLRSIKGVEGVLVSGDKPVLLYESNGRLNYSALSYGSLRAAGATLPAEGGGASEVILVQGSTTAAATATGSSAPSSTSVHVLQVGEAKKIEIETVNLGSDNPLGIALDASEGKRAFGVITWKYVPEGDGAVVDGKGKARRGKGMRGKVVVVDQETFETIDSLDLEAGEHPHCIECVTLGGRTFFVVGTGWDNPMESETLSGRIIGLELVPSRWKSGDRELSTAFSQKVRGGVNAVVGAQGFLVAAINSQVVSYQTRPSSSAERELSLQRRGAWACAFFATTLVAPAADPGRLLVGDAMRSLVVLKLDEGNGKVSELARECDPSWTSAVEELSSKAQSFVGADLSFNLFVSARTVVTPAIRARQQEAAGRAGATDLEGNAREAVAGERSSNTEPRAEGDFTHVIKRRGHFHLGDMVNRFRKGALLHQEGLSVMKDTIRPNVVFCTAGGALGLLADMGNRCGTLLACLVQAVDGECPTLGNIPVREWRAFRTDHREMASYGFVDGDVLLGRFLELRSEERARVVERWKGECEEGYWGDEAEEERDGLADAVAGLARLC